MKKLLGVFFLFILFSGNIYSEETENITTIDENNFQLTQVKGIVFINNFLQGCGMSDGGVYSGLAKALPGIPVYQIDQSKWELFSKLGHPDYSGNFTVFAVKDGQFISEFKDTYALNYMYSWAYNLLKQTGQHSRFPEPPEIFVGPRSTSGHDCDLTQGKIAYYSFSRHLRDNLGISGGCELEGTVRIQDGQIDCNGEYDMESDAFMRPEGFNWDKFSFSLDVKPQKSSTVLFVIGYNYPHIAFWLKGDDLLIEFQQKETSIAYNCKNSGIKVDQWNSISVSADIENEYMMIAINGKRFKDIKMSCNGPEFIKKEGLDYNMSLHFVVYCSGDFFKGHADNISFYERALNPKELETLNLASFAKNTGSEPLLLKAISNNQQDMAAKLLDKQLSVNWKNDQGKTALHIAARQGNKDIAGLLFKHGAYPDPQDNSGLTPLMEASEKGSLDLARYLVSMGADPKLNDRQGRSAIVIAQNKGYGNLAKYLKEASSLNLSDEKLEKVIKGGDLVTITEYLEEGGKVDKLFYYTYSLLDMAVFSSHYDIVKLLLEKGADPNHIYSDNQNSCFYAAGAWDHEILELLINYGGRVNLIDKDGFNCLDNVYDTDRVHPGKTKEDKQKTAEILKGQGLRRNKIDDQHPQN